jgi:hypothetical protein
MGNKRRAGAHRLATLWRRMFESGELLDETPGSATRVRGIEREFSMAGGGIEALFQFRGLSGVKGEEDLG